MAQNEDQRSTTVDNHLAQRVNQQIGEGDLIDLYLKELITTLEKFDRDILWQITNVLLNAWKNGSQVFIMGNGGSAATASHMANDLNKFTISDGKKRFRAIALTDNVPLMTAWGNDDSYEDIFSEQLKNFMDPGDVIVAISTSGNSPNVLKGVKVGREIGGVVIALTGDTGGSLGSMADYCFFVPSPKIGPQEDGHMIVDHILANTLKRLIDAV